MSDELKDDAPEPGVIDQVHAAADLDAELARKAFARADAWAKAPAGTRYEDVEFGDGYDG